MLSASSLSQPGSKPGCVPPEGLARRAPGRSAPHLHMIVPAGGISLDGTRWVPCRPGFFLPVRVLSRPFRRLFLAGLVDPPPAGRLGVFRQLEGLRRPEAFPPHLAPP